MNLLSLSLPPPRPAPQHRAPTRPGLSLLGSLTQRVRHTLPRARRLRRQARWQALMLDETQMNAPCL